MAAHHMWFQDRDAKEGAFGSLPEYRLAREAPPLQEARGKPRFTVPIVGDGAGDSVDRDYSQRDQGWRLRMHKRQPQQGLEKPRGDWTGAAPNGACVRVDGGRGCVAGILANRWPRTASLAAVSGSPFAVCYFKVV
ncbi:hypothetical protein N7530_008048 [Penicillium desertorum]|uniref:Uncharacterized protein n=1 Tax=Penicillium desertorum TaxID=1303715 RepID=A0A9X0BKI1_9EURO|nr:hypothetical protein N7530_008048 [Penicillium desertorum]